MADDDVQLTDLEVIQRWSLAVRSATADRAEVVAALRADLAWLEGRSGARKSTSTKKTAARATTRTASTRSGSRSSTGRR